MTGAPGATTQKRRSRIGRAFFFFLKVLYLAPFIALGLWLLSLVYLQGVEVKKPFTHSTESKVDDILKLLSHNESTVPRDHFHMVDEYIDVSKQNQPVCVMCHGTYAHGKETKTRSILNMHDGFIACYVCHSRIENHQDTPNTKPSMPHKTFAWVDRQTGEIKHAVTGEYGKYPAQIFPVEYTDQGIAKVVTPIQAEAAQALYQLLPELTSDQVSKAKAKLHEPLSKEAVTCTECHKKDGYLDFKALGFPQQRIDHLISTEFVGMFAKYDTFYLPSVIDFGGK